MYIVTHLLLQGNAYPHTTLFVFSEYLTILNESDILSHEGALMCMHAHLFRMLQHDCSAALQKKKFLSSSTALSNYGKVVSMQEASALRRMNTN
jgi:hypothetical protein